MRPMPWPQRQGGRCPRAPGAWFFGGVSFWLVIVMVAEEVGLILAHLGGYSIMGEQGCQARFNVAQGKAKGQGEVLCCAGAPLECKEDSGLCGLVIVSSRCVVACGFRGEGCCALRALITGTI